MPPVLTPDLRELLISQDNVVANWQLKPLQRRAATRAVRCRQWQRLSNQVFLCALGEASPQQLVWAAVLHCGHGARLSGRTALVLHGWEQSLQPPHDVVVPLGVQPPRDPDVVRIHRLSGPLDGPQALPPRTTPHAATVHAAAWARTDREAMFILVSSLQQRLTHPTRVQNELVSLPRVHRRRLMAEVVREFTDGAHSLNELDFGALCRRFFVPPPIRQTKITDSGGKPRAIDARFRTTSGRELRVEIEGLHHLDPTQYMADVDRHNALALSDPATSLRITTWHLHNDPAPFMTGLGRAILHG